MMADSNMSDSGFYRSQKLFQQKHKLEMEKINVEARSQDKQNKENIIKRFISWLKLKLLNK